MSLEEAVAKAREIAAKLSGISAGSYDLSNKRKLDDMLTPGLGSLQRKKVYIPTQQYPDVNFLGLLIGPKGATQKQLQERSGAKILVRGKGSQKEGMAPHPDDNDELHVSIEGPSDSVEIALRDVEQILFNPEEAMKLKGEQLRTLNASSATLYSSLGSGSDYQEELKVPNAMVGLIIGRGGDQIQKLQMQTGGQVVITKESEMLPGETHRSIFLKGSRDVVQQLREKIDDIINAKLNPGAKFGLNSLKDLDHPIVMKVPVPNDRVGYIIGKGGMNIKNIQEKTRTTVFIPQGPDDNDPNTRTLSIGADSRDAAEAAHAEIYSILQLYQQTHNLSSANSTSMAICVPDDKVGIIIGKGGCNIKDLQNRHRIRLQIPQQADPGSNPPVRTCTIQGSQESQIAARYEIEMILQGQGHLIQSAPIPAVNAAPAISSNPYASMYDPNTWAAMSASGQYDQSALYAQQYAGYYSQAAATTSSASSSETAVPTDPTAYYNDFWKYASYYGEAAARTYYGAWSPPAGTPPPPGTSLPSSTSTATTDNSADSNNIDTKSTSASSTTSATRKENSEDDNTTSNTSDGAKTTENSNDQQGAVATTDAAAAWETYKKQYAEWYEAYGKYQGADPNPPQPA